MKLIMILLNRILRNSHVVQKALNIFTRYPFLLDNISYVCMMWQLSSTLLKKLRQLAAQFDSLSLKKRNVKLNIKKIVIRNDG